jgi:hypothetical protein
MTQPKRDKTLRLTNKKSPALLATVRTVRRHFFMSAHYFIANSNRAYRSEISLFRHEGETAADCWMVQASAGAAMLYEITGPGDRVSITADLGEAWERFARTKAEEINAIPVVD